MQTFEFDFLKGRKQNNKKQDFFLVLCVTIFPENAK
jgi:hypothetical protein